MTEGSIPSHSTTKEAKNRRRFAMAVVYEKVTLLVANDVGHRLADIGCWEFEESWNGHFPTSKHSGSCSTSRNI